jgi:nucleoside-diphosphate-sugar epimerase
MKIFVTGATGAIGRRAITRLVEAGHDVTGTARSPAKADQVRASGARPVTVDLFDAADVRNAVAGHDVVCHLATRIPALAKAALPGAWAENSRLRRDASRLLVDAALAGDAGRYVGESLAFSYADGGSRWLDEESPLDLTSLTQTIGDAEASATRMTESGRTGVVLRFGQHYGSDAAYTLSMVKAARRRLSTSIGDADAYRATIQLDDAAAAVVAALGAPAGFYNVVDDEPLRQRDFDEALAAAVGVDHLRSAGRLLARLAGRRLSVLARSQRVSNHRLKKATDWSPRYSSVREGWPAVVADIDAGTRAVSHG